MLDGLDRENQKLEKLIEEAFIEGEAHGFTVKYEHGIIWIDTMYEKFCYKPNYSGNTIRLLHESKNTSTRNKGFNYHEQFCWEITTKELFDWIEGHTNYKYKPKTRKRTK